MGSVNRVAGASGSVTLTMKTTAGALITPVSVPSVQWFTDAGRTAGAVTLTVTGSSSTYVATWTAGQAPATPAIRYLKVTIEVSTGVFDIDADDEIGFLDSMAVITTFAWPTIGDLSDYLGEPITNTIHAQVALDSARAAVQSYTRQRIEPVTETLTLLPEHNTVLFLPELPVSAVSSVTIGGVLLAATAYYLDGPIGALKRVDGASWLVRASGGGPSPIAIAHSHGYATIPDDIRWIVLDYAAKSFVNPVGVRSQTVGPDSVSYIGSRGQFDTLTTSVLDRYRILTCA